MKASSVALQPRRQTRGLRLRTRIEQVGLTAVLMAVAVAMIAPVYWAITTSFVPLERAFELPPRLIPPTFTLENYVRVFVDIPFGRQILNSLKITTIITLGILVVSTLAAYAFASLRFPGREVLFVLLLAAMMIPSQMTFIPVFIIIRHLGLVDTHEAIYLPALINAFSIFLLRQHFLSIPRSLLEAARVDGASHLQVLTQIVLPNSLPVLAGIAVLQFQHHFNDFFWPLIVLFTPEQFTIPLGLVTLKGEFNTAPTAVTLAAISAITVPLVTFFVIAQRFVTQSFLHAGLKM
jgi:multiple sugar transport system permease protein